MGGVALAPFAAAVSEAGGIGTIALAGFTPEAMLSEISAARALTKKPLGVNLLSRFYAMALLSSWRGNQSMP